ncbi:MULTISPECIES: plasmid replication protein [Bacteria]|uniref:Uncharacterized protein n=3 Tax=Gammaproteobacteria TaxID=1236 RepID=A0A0U3TDQ5_PRORE|nr:MULTISPECIES: plasmid replication protein [Gammaproteobacteria]ALV81728.1 hypothetical protein AOY08_100008 [Providencia rettgeri]ELR5224364.1 plasmid replication protein [Providencia rettgeri]MDG4698926.1 plasmid replication protein [Providencia sp. CRE-3FA-0001]MDX7324553.1 plasmid replication protein [Providencia rettgeri]OBY34056.1 hypothetical protein PR729_06210 [Providencia rettgeri]
MKIKNQKRNTKAKDLAFEYGVSIATVKKYYSQDREDYEQEAAARRKQAFELRQKGLAWREVADSMNATIDAVKSLAKRYKQQDLNLIG